MNYRTLELTKIFVQVRYLRPKLAFDVAVQTTVLLHIHLGQMGRASLLSIMSINPGKDLSK